MSLSYNIYKLKKYKSKYENKPDNIIYKNKYIYYYEQFGGALGLVVEGLIRAGAFCRLQRPVTQQVRNISKTLNQEQLLEETSNKVYDFYRLFKKKIEDNVLEGIAKKEYKLNIEEVIDNNISTNKIKEGIKQTLISYAENPTCPVTGIKLTGTNNDEISKELAGQIDKISAFATNLNKNIISSASHNLNQIKLSPNAIDNIRNIYLKLD